MALRTIRPKLSYASLSKVTTLRSEGGCEKVTIERGRMGDADAQVTHAKAAQQ